MICWFWVLCESLSSEKADYITMLYNTKWILNSRQFSQNSDGSECFCLRRCVLQSWYEPAHSLIFRLILLLPVSLHWLNPCVLLSFPLSQIGLRNPISDLILKLASVPCWLRVEYFPGSHCQKTWGNKGEQMFCWVLCHDFFKPVKPLILPALSYTFSSLKRFSVFWRICGYNFKIMLKCFLPFMVFRASWVCLRPALLNAAFPGSTVQGLTTGKVHLKDFCGGSNPTLHFFRFSLVFCWTWDSKWWIMCLVVLDSQIRRDNQSWYMAMIFLGMLFL